MCRLESGSSGSQTRFAFMVNLWDSSSWSRTRTRISINGPDGPSFSGGAVAASVALVMVFSAAEVGGNLLDWWI